MLSDVGQRKPAPLLGFLRFQRDFVARLYDNCDTLEAAPVLGFLVKPPVCGWVGCMFLVAERCARACRSVLRGLQKTPPPPPRAPAPCGGQEIAAVVIISPAPSGSGGGGGGFDDSVDAACAQSVSSKV